MIFNQILKRNKRMRNLVTLRFDKIQDKIDITRGFTGISISEKIEKKETKVIIIIIIPLQTNHYEPHDKNYAVYNNPEFPINKKAYLTYEYILSFIYVSSTPEMRASQSI